MRNREDILNELREISPAVAAVPFVNVFTVGAAYFEGIEAEWRARITADSFYADKGAFTVPQGYFENLAGNIMNRIRQEENISAADEMKQLSGVIAGIGNKNIFTVPERYFENLSPNIETKAPVKIVQMTNRRSVFRYAAAAVITGLLGISIINISDKGPTVRQDDTARMAAVMQKANDIIKNNSFDKELNSLSDEDLEAYLSDNRQDVNAAVVAASASDKAETLPEAADYILNENTLDEFLDENNLKN